MRLLIATGNAHKLSEIRAILSIRGLELVGLDEFPGVPAVEEDAGTFDGNARKKATEVARATGLWTLADDSGLEVDALGGAPGVYSARYAGKDGDSAANNRKLLEALEGVSDRTARFRCVVALSDPNGRARTVQGRCEGTILEQPRGGGGFGYDPLFVPDGYEATFSELPGDVKNRISHRGAALKAAHEAWGAELVALVEPTPL